MPDTITISRDEYDHLRAAAEHLTDLAAYDAAKRALASGEDELIPAEFANRILDGENPITVYREMRGLSKMQLAERAGVDRVQLTDIEKGRKTGSVATLKRLADALGVTIDDLL